MSENLTNSSEKSFLSTNRCFRQKYGTTTDLFARPQSNVLKSVSVPTTIGPSPFSTGPPDPWAMARANVSNRGMVQQQPAPPLQPGAPPAYGLGSTPASSLGIFGTKLIARVILKRGETDFISDEC